MSIGIGIGIPGKRQRMAPGFSTILSWTRGDLGTRASGLYDAIAESGTMGGSFAYDSERPTDTVQFADLKHVPSYASTQRMKSSLANTSWDFLHNGSQSFTITGRVYFKSIVHGARLLATYNTGNANRGLAVIVSSTVLAVYVGNGTSSTVVSSTVTLSANTWYTFAVTYAAGGNYTIQVNTETPVSGAHTTDAGNAQHTMYIGNESSGAAPANGFIAEVIIHGRVLNSGELSAMRAYYASRWWSVPGVVIYLDADHGVTLNGSNVSAWADRAIGNDVAQGTAGAQPAMVSSWRNGRSALQFDGVNDTITRATFLHGDLAQPSSIYHAGEFPDPFGGYWLSSSANASFRNDCYVSAAATEQLASYAGSTLVAGSYQLGTLAGLPFTHFTHFSGASSSIGLRPHGQSPATAGGNLGTTARRGITIGALVGPSSFWPGKIACVVCIDHVPTAGHSEILSALSDYYNIVAT